MLDLVKLEKIEKAAKLRTFSNRRDTIDPIYVDEKVSSEGEN